jgi:hypothetical protein
MRISHLAAITLLFLAFGGTPVQAADCRDISGAKERAKLQGFLAANDFSPREQAFLLKGVEQRVKEMPESRLNASGAACGIKAVRAQILGCLNQTLPSTYPSLSAPERKTGKAFWGKANVSAREGTVIGLFHACRGAAMEHFFSVM